MRDWEALVEGHLGGLALEPAERAEVIAELAAHLEESYEALLKEGAPEHVAFHRVLSRATNWRDLRRRIIKAKRSGHPMQKRMHQLWIPGFLTMTLSIVFLVALQKLAFDGAIRGNQLRDGGLRRGEQPVRGCQGAFGQGEEIGQKHAAHLTPAPIPLSPCGRGPG